MDRFFITGDFHGAQSGEHHFLTNKYVKSEAEKHDVDFDNLKYCVMCGDTGFLWKGDSSVSKTGWWTAWFNDKPYTTLCIPGNHDNYEDIYSDENICPVDDPVYKDLGEQPLYKISKKVYFLKRGYVYNICGKKVLALGGATSIDRLYRKLNVSWFAKEEWSSTEIADLESKLPLTVDIVVSHTCPSSVIPLLNSTYGLKDSVADLNQHILENITTKEWYFGHFHFTKYLSHNNVDFITLFKSVAFVNP